MKTVERKTILSSCRQYRYCLWREWDMMNHTYAMFVGLNPSTADEVEDDLTIRRCVDYARQWGYGGLCMVNLFAYRATEPAVMKSYAAPVGAENDRWLLDLAKDAGVIVAAWGVNGTHLKRDKAVMQLLDGKLSCLKKTKDEHPSHPLYLKRSLKPCSFP
ncbi:MAG: DUF1643 domain-containing protein [Gammaproteobacteria bacterium]|nr:DUF1643 domain-containing protein [Gammaproteobacteria bacterium]